MAKRNLTLKLLVDKEKQRVLFAEAGKEAVDFLFSLLALPVGTVTRLLTAKGMVGSVGKLYGSLERLDGTYMQVGFNKTALLKPTTSCNTSGQSALLPECEYSFLPSRNKYYRCDGDERGGYRQCSKGSSYVTDDIGAPCPSCKRPMRTELTYVANKPEMEVNANAGGGYVKEVVTYMVMDDLAVEPMSTISSITLLNRFHIREVCSLEERTVELGIKEGLRILKAAFQTITVLSDVFLKRAVT